MIDFGRCFLPCFLTVAILSGCSSQESTDVSQQTAGSVPADAGQPQALRADGNAAQLQPDDPAIFVSQKSHLHETKSIAADATPENVVNEFLQALKTGDDALAELLLTRKAREETARNNLAVLPPGAPTAEFQVGKFEFTDDKQGAWVPCIWMEAAASGSRESYEITWALRKESSGWRIAGMATQLIPQQLPLFLNFEDPVAMMQKLRDATEQAQSSDGQVRQAQIPADSQIR